MEIKQDINLHRVWSTPIMTTTFGHELQGEICDIYDDIVFIETPYNWGKTHKVSKPQTDYFLDDVISEFKLDVVSDAIDNMVQEYCRVYGVPYAKYTRTSWFTMFTKGDYAHVHNHTSSSISGCYYYQTTNRDGNIFFKCPISAMSANPAWTNMSMSYEIQPEVGKMILFPGWLDHGVRTNNTDDIRISLAFNIDFDYRN